MKLKLMIGLVAIYFCPFLMAETVAQTKANNQSNSNIIKGKMLISKSDCVSCHKPTVKLIGPSFQDIARKYPPTIKNYNLLIEKIIKGGSGVWGPMAMSPHTTLSKADAKKMVAYILSVK